MGERQMLPWHIKSTLIIILFLLVLPQNALFCKGFWDYGKMLWNYRLWQIRAELGMLLLPVSSKIGSKREMVTTNDFQIHISNSVIVLTNSCNSVSVENFLNDFSSLLGCCWRIASNKVSKLTLGFLHNIVSSNLLQYRNIFTS